jgi:N-acyl-L-homoserine lactone synthetase
VPEDPSTPGEERDSYDAHCIHLGAFQGGRLVAYFRMLPARAGVGFMFDGPLRPILNDEKHRSIVRERSVELSRRAVHPDLSPPEAIAAIETLFMFVYRIWLREGFEDLYIVQEPRTLPFFERIYGLRFSPVTQVPYRFPDGTLTVVAHSSAKDLLASLERSGRRQAYEAFARQGMTARAMTLA